MSRCGLKSSTGGGTIGTSIYTLRARGRNSIRRWTTRPRCARITGETRISLRNDAPNNMDLSSPFPIRMGNISSFFLCCLNRGTCYKSAGCWTFALCSLLLDDEPVVGVIILDMYFPGIVARGLRWLFGFVVSTVLLVSSPPSHEIPPQDEREPSHDQPPWPQQQYDDGVPASENKDGNLVKELLAQCLRGPALPATSCRLGRHAQIVALAPQAPRLAARWVREWR